jgi:hypothetical protein
VSGIAPQVSPHGVNTLAMKMPVVASAAMNGQIEGSGST